MYIYYIYVYIYMYTRLGYFPAHVLPKMWLILGSHLRLIPGPHHFRTIKNRYDILCERILRHVEKVAFVCFELLQDFCGQFLVRERNVDAKAGECPVHIFTHSWGEGKFFFFQMVLLYCCCDVVVMLLWFSFLMSADFEVVSLSLSVALVILHQLTLPFLLVFLSGGSGLGSGSFSFSFFLINSNYACLGGAWGLGCGWLEILCMSRTPCSCVFNGFLLVCGCCLVSVSLAVFVCFPSQMHIFSFAKHPLWKTQLVFFPLSLSISASLSLSFYLCVYLSLFVCFCCFARFFLWSWSFSSFLLLVLSLWHKIVTNKKWFWNNCFFWEKFRISRVIPWTCRFLPENLRVQNDKTWSGNYFRNAFVSEGNRSSFLAGCFLYVLFCFGSCWSFYLSMILIFFCMFCFSCCLFSMFVFMWFVYVCVNYLTVVSKQGLLIPGPQCAGSHFKRFLGPFT